jgi:DNA repair exonuclease SbcCD nuclease subunit
MIKKSKVAIFSDLHLGIYGNSESWHKVALEWGNWIAKELNKKKIKDIFFLGDFFHNRSEISVQTIHVASQILDKLSEFNIIMIVGNHDAFYKNRSDIHSLALLNGHKNLTIVDKNLTISEFDKELLFVPWNSELPDGKFDYIFGHFEIQNFNMNNFKVCDHGMSSMDFLASRTDTVFSGHFHHRNTKKYNEGSIHYIGNTFPMDFADTGNTKGYHILDIEDGNLEFFENTVSPKFKKITFSKIKDYKKEDFENNVVKLIVDIDATEKQVEKVQTYIAKFKPFQFNTEYNTTSKTVEDVEEIDSIDLSESMVEFVGQLKLEDEKSRRVNLLLKDLYAKNKV